MADLPYSTLRHLVLSPLHFNIFGIISNIRYTIYFMFLNFVGFSSSEKY